MRHLVMFGMRYFISFHFQLFKEGHLSAKTGFQGVLHLQNYNTNVKGY